ncbi:MAG: helix-turn-helix domain-containing protein [Ferruginibacter sp.]
MEALYIPSETDFKKWIKEAVVECLQNSLGNFKPTEQEDKLQNRKEIAKLLNVSLPTLTDWIKRGLPSHKQRGRVYFMKSEVLDYIREKKMKQLKFGKKLQHLNAATG